MMRLKLDNLAFKKYKNQNQLSKAFNVSFAACKKLLNGETKSISFDTLESICKALDCTPNDIFTSDDPQMRKLLLLSPANNQSESSTKGDE